MAADGSRLEGRLALRAVGHVIAVILCTAAMAFPAPSYAQTPVEKGPAVAARPKPCAPRVYPPESLKAREAGTSWVKITLVRDGTPIKAEVVRSSGHARLDAATLEHVKTCKFRPGKVEGVRTLTMRYRWDPDGR